VSEFVKVHVYLYAQLLCSENYAANDVAGNFSLTLVDVLDTLVVLGDRSGFEQAVKNVIQWVSFDVSLNTMSLSPRLDISLIF
jgi:hypothetical protein